MIHLPNKQPFQSSLAFFKIPAQLAKKKITKKVMEIDIVLLL